MGYVTTTEVRNMFNVPATITDAMLEQFIDFAERDVDRFTYTTYWNTEYSGTATSATNNTLTQSSASFPTSNGLSSNYYITLTSGTGSGQYRQIISNTSTQVTVDRNWSTNPDATTTYQIFYAASQPRLSDAYDGNNQQTMFVPSYPVRLIESLTINSTTVTPSAVLVYANVGKLYLGDTAEYRYFDGKKPQLVNLAYWFGVPQVGAEIKEYVCLKASILALQQLQASSYNTPLSYNLPEGSVTMKSPTDAITATLKSYLERLEQLSCRLIRYQSLG